MKSIEHQLTKTLRRIAVAGFLMLGATGWSNAASAAQDGTIFDDRVFEWRYYLDPNVNSDLQAAGIVTEAQARQHWQNHGIGEGRRGGPGFNSVQYLSLNADLSSGYGATNYSGGIGHYLAHGYTEGRWTQSSCPINYDLSGYNANVPAYCFAKQLNATITSTDQSFSKYVFCFPLPASGRVINGLTGNVSINTASAGDNPSEALVAVGYASGACPANGTKYTSYPIPFNGTVTTLGTFIMKRLGAGGSTASTSIDFPAIKGTGNLFVLFDGGPSLGAGNPITSITMKSNVTLKTTTTAASPVPYAIDGTDEYCFNMPGGCMQATSSTNATFARVLRVTGTGSKLVGLVGNVSAGAITRPSSAWSFRNDWYVDYGCSRFPMANKWVETFTNATNVTPPPGGTAAIYKADLSVPAGVPTYGFALSGSGDSLQQTVNVVGSTPVTPGVDCIVHTMNAGVNSQINGENQVRYFIQ